MSTRHGRLCKIPQINLRVTGTIRTIREGSFQIRGPQLFNSIPANIRGLTRCTVNTFKHKLDDYLKNIPDTQKIPGYTIQTDTNSITSMRGSRESWAIQLRRSHRLGQRDYSQTLNLNLNLNTNHRHLDHICQLLPVYIRKMIPLCADLCATCWKTFKLFWLHCLPIHNQFCNDMIEGKKQISSIFISNYILHCHIVDATWPSGSCNMLSSK